MLASFFSHVPGPSLVLQDDPAELLGGHPARHQALQQAAVALREVRVLHAHGEAGLADLDRLKHAGVAELEMEGAGKGGREDGGGHRGYCFSIVEA